MILSDFKALDLKRTHVFWIVDKKGIKHFVQYMGDEDPEDDKFEVHDMKLGKPRIMHISDIDHVIRG